MSRCFLASLAVSGAVLGIAAGCGSHAGTQDAHGMPGDVADSSLDAFVPLDVPGGADVPPSDLPDLQFVANEMANTVVVTNDNFAADDCVVMEGCVNAPGSRILLRFDTVTANRGAHDLVVGVPPPPGQSNPVFQWSACHMHHHFANYTSYELVNSTGVVITGRKQAFCLEDGEQVQPGAPATGYSCDNQGISRGWADVYTRYLPCQWIDVTGVPSGSYTLRVILNPAHVIPESDYTNNVFTVPVQF
jgi:Lysyl oxidase